MTSRERPLSPFLIYRFDYTMVLSFSHRVTGVVLAAGSLILVTWLLGQFPVGFFFNDFLKSIMVFGLLLILVMLPLSVYSAYAKDVVGKSYVAATGRDGPGLL